MKDFQYKDIQSVQKLFQCLPLARIKRTLGYREMLEVGRLALNQSFRTREQALRNVFNYFNSETPPPPAPECNCPAASGTRWHNFPVTWSYSAYEQDIPNTADLIRENWKTIQAVCSLTVEETNDATCNICINNDQLDGRGGTLGIAYIPASGDRMAACGRTCGNIVIDKDEIWTVGFLQTVLLHEMLHAVGIPHAPSRSSIMYPRYLGVRLELDTWTVQQLQSRYPLEAAA